MKKVLTLIVAIIVTVGSVVTGVMASNITIGPIIELSDAIMAADVCAEHLENNCNECNGYDLDASYSVDCFVCGGSTTLCCSGVSVGGTNEANCYVITHPDGCRTMQALCWNAYFCRKCVAYVYGTRANDYHVEAYWHLKEPTCYDNAYCSKSRLEDLVDLAMQDLLSGFNGTKVVKK